MKKLIVFLFLLTSLVANAQSDSLYISDVDVYMSVYIEDYTDLLGISEYKQDTLSPLCKKYFGYRQQKSWENFSICVDNACESVLDSNYYENFPDDYHPHLGHVDYDGELVFEFFGKYGAEHTPFEVIRDHLVGWSRCGFLRLTESQVDSLVNRIQQKAGKIWSNEVSEHAGRVLRYESLCLNTTFKNDSTADCLYLDRYDYVPNNNFPLPIADEDYESAGVSVMLQRNSPSIQVIDGRLVAPASLVGSPYSLLDLNGCVLRSGLLEQNMPLPHYPVILKIEGQKEIFIRN